LEGQKIFLGGQDFFHYIFKINLSGNKNLGALPRNATYGCGPGLHHRFGSRLKIPECEIASLMLVNWQKALHTVTF